MLDDIWVDDWHLATVHSQSLQKKTFFFTTKTLGIFPLVKEITKTNAIIILDYMCLIFQCLRPVIFNLFYIMAHLH